MNAADEGSRRIKHRTVVLVCVLYVGMIALLLGVFFGIGLMILAGGSGWLLVPMIAAGVACLRVGNWWLPTLARLVGIDREE